MRGIALKIFLSFWLIFALLIATFAVLPDEGAGVRFIDHLHQDGVVAASLLERVQEFVPQERAVAGERVPGRRVGGADCRQPFELKLHAPSVPVAAPSVEPSGVSPRAD